MKLLLSFLFITYFIIQNSLFAQYERAEQAIKTAPYIFEGKVVALDFIQDDQANYFVSYKVEVLKSLKGGKYLKEKDTVELVSEMPTGWYIFENGEFGSAPLQGMPPSLQKGLRIFPPLHGVFVVAPNLYGVTYKSSFLSFYSIQLSSDSYFAITPIDRYNNDTRKPYVNHDITGFGLKFSSLEEFNVFLKKMRLPSLYRAKKCTKR